MALVLKDAVDAAGVSDYIVEQLCALGDRPGNQGRERKHAVQQIADEFNVTRPTIYRHLAKATSPAPIS